MMLYKDIFFYIFTEVLYRNVLTPFLFIIFPDYLLRMSIDLMKEHGFILKRQEAEDILPKQLQI